MARLVNDPAEIRKLARDFYSRPPRPVERIPCKPIQYVREIFVDMTANPPTVEIKDIHG